MRLTMLAFLALLLALAGGLALHSRQGYAYQDREAVGAAASSQHIAGTDELGRDRAVRLALALLLGAAGACVASAVSCCAAIALGTLAGSGPGWLAKLLLYGGDLFLTLPWIFLLMLIRSLLPLTLPPVRSGSVTFLLLGILGIPTFLRMNYEQMVALLRADWLFQARALGLHNIQLFRQMLPHLRPLLWTQFLLYVPSCLIAEANLGQLGMGLGEPLPSWGNLIAGLQSASMVSTSHLIYLPVITLVLVLTALELTVYEVQR